MKIAVFGLGKLGCPIAAVFASKGHDVTGVDVNARAVDLVNRGQAPVEETGLQDLLATLGGRLRATTDGEGAVAASDLSIVIVPTPSEPSGAFSLSIMLDAATAVGRGLKKHSGYHVVVIASTVLPGAMDRDIVPAIEKASGKRHNADFGICYSPEFVALGNVIHDMLNPDILLIGEGNARAGSVVENFYRGVVDNTPSFLHMSIVNAEVTKLSVNTYVTTKISFANMLADICERIPGADARIVTAAIGRDSRIGSKFIAPGAAYGGPCFPRDNKALSFLARSLGGHARLAETTDEVNRDQSIRLAEIAARNLPAGGRVGILGLSYKPDAVIAEESAGYHLALGLAERGIAAIAYDPVAMDHARHLLGDRISFASSAEDCLAQASVVVIATPWKSFTGLQYRPGQVLIDCWKSIDPATLNNGVTYIALGRGPSL